MAEAKVFIISSQVHRIKLLYQDVMIHYVVFVTFDWRRTKCVKTETIYVNSNKIILLTCVGLISREICM